MVSYYFFSLYFFLREIVSWLLFYFFFVYALNVLIELWFAPVISYFHLFVLGSTQNYNVDFCVCVLIYVVSFIPILQIYSSFWPLSSSPSPMALISYMGTIAFTYAILNGKCIFHHTLTSPLGMQNETNSACLQLWWWLCPSLEEGLLHRRSGDGSKERLLKKFAAENGLRQRWVVTDWFVGRGLGKNKPRFI